MVKGIGILGIRVPAIRKCAKEYCTLSLRDIENLLRSPFHEARLLAVLILVARYSSEKQCGEQQAIFRFYLRHAACINNWDLVDCSAPHIIGAHLFSRNRKPVYRLVRSKSLWERRMAVMSTLYFVKRDDFTDTLTIAAMLLADPEDLIHKAVGWMLREVGKRSRDIETGFLARHYKEMPRTMLRYAIEKLPESERQAYLHGSYRPAAQSASRIAPDDARILGPQQGSC